MEVRGFLEGLRSRLRRVLLLEGLSLLAVAVLVGCALAILLDYCWPIPGPVRFVLLLALTAVVATVAYRRLLRPLARRMDDRTMAQLAERRIPGLDGRLLTRVDGIDLGHHDGELLAAALTPQVVTTLVPARRLPARLSLAVVLLGAAGLCVLAFPRLIHDGFNRLLLPFGAGEWERKSALAGALDRTVVAADEPLVVRLERTKGPEAALRLSWSSDEQGQTERRMLSGLAGPWHQALTLPPGTYRLVAESGDALPLVLHGRLVKRPLLTKVAAILTPPHYIALPPQQLATLACTALPGSRLEFALEFALDSGREVAEAGITLGGVPLKVTRSAHGLAGALTIKEGGMLEIHLADQDGIGPNPQPRFPITLTEDRKPVVALDGPHHREAVTVRARVHLAIDASDDYGLASLQLLTAVLPGAPAADGAAAPAPAPAASAPLHQETLAFDDIAGRTATTRTTVVDLARLVKEGDRLQFTGRAEDANDISGPGVGLSQPLELRVVSESELRQELDRMLGEAKDRLAQAREELGGGLAKPERLVPASRGASLVAVKVGELLAQVVRRWSENQLQEDQLKPAREAAEVVNGKAALQLAEAVKGSAAAARSADQLLSEAEKLLASMLQAGDLTRLLATLIEREKALAVESRAFVMEYLTKALDEAAKVRQANLTQRQKELADQVKEVERRILALTSKQLEKAQDLVRSQGPADQLQQAAAALGSENRRADATRHQETAIAALIALLDLLRGSDAAGDLAKQAGALAARQEQLDKQLEEGAVPKSLEAEQRKLHEDTEQFKRQLDKQPQAEKAVAAASQAQGEAEKAMAGDDSASAQREGATAASELREAQRQLDGEQDKKKEPKKKGADVLALLRELHHLQAALLADSLPVFTRLGDKALDFAAQRDVTAFAEREGDILLRLREEGFKPVEKMPIVIAAMNRVALALDKAQSHLAQPALGTHGIRLEKIALAELARLIEIAENIPPPEKQDGDGKGGGNGNQAPFPPGAELALLAAMQEELAALTAAGRPVDLAGMQQEAGKLVELLAANSRPGSRPSLLLARALRAMKSAGDNLSAGDRGLATRHEQAAAEAALRRLMAEAKGGGGSEPKPQPQQKPGQNPSKPPPPADGAPSGTPGGNRAPTSASKGDGKSTTATVPIDPTKQQLLTLPQELRDKLLEAHKQPLPPGALHIFERYLELLEEGK